CGHALGDQLLQNVAQRLKNLSEKYDDSTQQQVFRLGSDEFAYLCSPQLEEQYSVALAKQLIDTLSMPYDVEHAQVEISACIGITQIRNGNDDATQIIKRADLALQRAKQSSEPIALYAEDMDEALNRQIALAPLLRQAIKCDELHLAFQPKICSHDHSVHGFEVLCRWNDHNGQAIPADWFITTAENSRLIKPLTEWVIKRLLSIESEWQRRQMPRNLAFNLSARLLDNTALIRKLCEKLRASQGYCEFEFEITESSLMTNPKRALASINAIRQAGFAISIDDYGTGYSSLAYLCDLDASALKIDRSFITNCHSNETNRIIVSSTVRMAHELGLRTVAEGIETAEEEKLLHSLGCDYLQGYRYSKPLVLDEIIPWFEKWQLQQHANIKRVEDYRPNKQG
ncbi:bifunctional diguanylate cyclase/phosphodiesterase, partial [bacterium]|nr:bifunctional diguanylate cyclase/phosphodiesterase [bacterium]